MNNTVVNNPKKTFSEIILSIKNKEPISHNYLNYVINLIHKNSSIYEWYDISINNNTTKLTNDKSSFIKLIEHLMKELNSNYQNKWKKEKTYNKINLILKLFDISVQFSTKINEDTIKSFYSIITKVNSITRDTINLEANLESKYSRFINQKKETIDMAVLFIDNPIARVYLKIMKELGYYPSKIIKLIPEYDNDTKKIIAQWMPELLRTSFLDYLYTQKINYWPKKLKKRYQNIYENISNELSKNYGFTKELFNGVYDNLILEDYSDNIEIQLFRGYGDHRIKQKIELFSEKNILFTGGGILPKKYFESKAKNFIHIHPGYLPNIRGADGSLWSLILYNCFSASSIVMNEKIDGGRIIERSCFKKINIISETLNLENENDLTTIYRIYYSFIDPWIRGMLLPGVINKINKGFAQNDFVKSMDEEFYFNFMHSSLRKNAFECLLK